LASFAIGEGSEDGGVDARAADAFSALAGKDAGGFDTGGFDTGPEVGPDFGGAGGADTRAAPSRSTRPELAAGGAACAIALSDPGGADVRPPGVDVGGRETGACEILASPGFDGRLGIEPRASGGFDGRLGIEPRASGGFEARPESGDPDVGAAGTPLVLPELGEMLSRAAIAFAMSLREGRGLRSSDIVGSCLR
jgi:hypothetical protein